MSEPAVTRAAARRPRALRSAAAVLIALGLSALPAAALAAGTTSGEQIDSYTIDLMLQKDGTMHVQETIGYDFGTNRKRGIFRTLNTEFAYGQDQLREYPISNVKVSSPTGAPADLQEDAGPVTVLRIGDPNVGDVTGKQTYVIDYDLKGVLNGFPDHQELSWNVVGTEWDVPVNRVQVSLEGPAAITKTACFDGVQGSTASCASAVTGNGAATFSAPQLLPREGMTVVASFPPNTFTTTAPIVKDRQTLARAFSVTPLTVAPSLAVIGGLGALLLGMVARRGRDERYLAVTPGLEPGFQQESRTASVPFMRRDPIAVQFQPPKDMRPGQLGTLIDEHANVVDVTATIVDLAVRGWLRIEEVEEPGRFRKGDWRLVEVTPAPSEPLHDYETKLFNSIFKGRSEVLLSELTTTFSSDLSTVQSMLYADVTKQGWFRGNPSTVRTTWLVLGGLLTAAGVGLTFLLAVPLNTRFGLVGVAVTLAGILLLIIGPRMPARTARGTALLAQAKGFELYLTKAEANQIRFEEGQDIFSRYLPYAIVFGVAERWAKVFADLAASGVSLAAPTWYSGTSYLYGSAFSYAAFGGSMSDFSTTTTGSIAAATPSSSGGSGFGGGGFSGGGGGGGGGGSW